MSDTPFDVWTRRQFGRASGGLFAAFIGFAGASDQVRAKQQHRKHHKRRKHHDPPCCGAADAPCGAEVKENCGCCEGLSCVFILGASTGHCVMLV